MRASSEPYAILFAGQLSEKAGMLSHLADHPIFKRIAGGFDGLTEGRFVRWVTNAPQEEISERFTAPAIMVLYDLLCAEVALSELGPPAAVTGYSLGFYAAAVFAHCVSAGTILTWLERVNASNALTFPPGEFALAASTGLSEAQLLSEFEAAGLSGVRIANVNNPRQAVFAGPRGEVERAIEALRGKVMDVRLVPLDVPLHTPYLETARLELATWWATVPAAAPVYPLVSPVDGKLITSGATFKAEMPPSLTSPTRWTRVSEAVASLGIRRALDLSPAGDLGRMTRWNVRAMDILPVSCLWEDRR